MIFNVSLFLDEILLNLVEIGGDAEEGGHQVQGEGNPKNTKKTPKKHQQHNTKKGGKEGGQRYSWKCVSEVIWDLHYQTFLFH